MLRYIIFVDFATHSCHILRAREQAYYLYQINFQQLNCQHPSQRTGIVLVSYITHLIVITIPNENVFNYKVVDLVGIYKFYTDYFFIWDHFKVLNFLNLKFKMQIYMSKSLKWKPFQLQCCRSGRDLQLLYSSFFHRGHFKVLKFEIWNANIITKRPQMKILWTTKL